MTNNISNSGYIDTLKKPTETSAGKQQDADKLGQEDFFALLTQQLSYQDPTKPADNDQMIAQMTNFTMAEGISDLNKNFSSLASSMTSNSALQASSLIGKSALIPGNIVNHDGAAAAGGKVLVDTTAKNLQLRVEDTNGALVKTVQLGDSQGGVLPFAWDGTDSNGNKMPPGDYVVKVDGKVGEEYKSFETSTYKNIQSVSINGEYGIILNTKDGSFTVEEVTEFTS